MRDAQLRQGQLRRQLPRVPNLQPVGKEHHLDAGVASVVAVRHGIDDGLSHGFARELVRDGRLRTPGACAHGAGDLGHHKVDRLVHQLERRALVDLVGRDGLAHLGAVEVQALDFGGEQEALRLVGEQKDGGVAGPPGVEQVEMG